MSGGGGDRPTLRKRLLFLVKLTVTLGLIGLILYQVDWPDFWRRLRAFEWWVIAGVLLIWAVLLTASVMKWQALLRVHGLRYPLGLLHRWYVISYFLSQFLPSIIGGDAFRIYKTLQNGRHRACAVLPVFVERASGLGALLIIGAVCAVIDWGQTGHVVSGWAAAVSAVGAVVGLAGLAVVWGLRLDRRLVRWPRTPNAVRALLMHSADYARHPGEMAWAVFISFFFHGFRVVVFWLLLLGMGYTTPYTQLAVITAAFTVIGMLPISLGGWGLIDGSFIGLAVLYGVPTEVGLTAMLMSRVTSLPIAIIGGLLYSTEKTRPAPPPALDETYPNPPMGGTPSPAVPAP